MDIVIANGTLLHVNDTNPDLDDLFFALRGAGDGSYGIVTHFVFKIYEKPQNVTYISFESDMTNMTNVHSLFEFYNKVGPSTSIDTTFLIKMEKTKNTRGLSLSFTGLYLGSSEEAKAELSRLSANFT